MNARILAVIPSSLNGAAIADAVDMVSKIAAVIETMRECRLGIADSSIRKHPISSVIMT
jgi:hypothetical protein